MNSIREDVLRRAHERARSLTKALASGEPLPLGEMASIVTAEAEQQMSGQLAVFPLGRLACKAGCAYCCHVPGVRVTVPELGRIARALSQLRPAELRALRRRIEGRARRPNPPDGDAPIPSKILPCPLLAGSRCLVYDVRPLVCRTEHSFDVTQCEAQFRTGEGSTLQCALVLDVAEGTLSGVAEAFRSAGLRGQLLDLTLALGIVLDRPAALEEWLRGGSSLRSAVCEG